MKETSRGIIVIANILYLFLIAACIYTIWRRGIETIEPRDLISSVLGVFGILVGYVLFICCLLDVQKIGMDLRYFRYLLGVTVLGLATDTIADLLDGFGQYWHLAMFCNTLHYMCTPVMMFLFWRYLRPILNLEPRSEKNIERFIRYGMFVMLASDLVDIFLPIYFAIEPDGRYHHTSTFPLCMIYPAITLLILCAVILKRRRYLDVLQTACLLIYIASGLIGTAVTVALEGINIANCEAILIMLLMYCVLNITQGREKVEADRDLATAAGIQESVLPTGFPYLPERKEFDLYASMKPAKEVGGDFYDFFMIGENHLALVIGDVAGKGVPAALFMMVARTLIKSEARRMETVDPSRILTAANDQLCENNDMGLFVTVWLGILDLSSGKMYCSRAGHEYPAFAKDGGRFELLKGRSSLPLGSMEGLSYRTEELVMEPGDTLFLYTDGVAEAMNKVKDLLGTERMLAALNLHPEASPADIEHAVGEAIAAFVGKASQFDDMTMLCLRYQGKEGSI